MENPGDKFASFIIPNCQRTSSQEEKLLCCPFTRESKASSDDIQSSSSPEQATGIEMLSLPDSFDEYQTPPDHHSCSQNSNNEGQRIVDLTNESDVLDTEQMDMDETEAAKSVNEAHQTEVICSPEEHTHQVFVEMLQREQKQNSNCSKNEAFKNIMNHVLKMVAEAKSRSGGGEDDERDVDFLETAKMRGLILPRPRWWPAEGFKD
ncbi:hypothetical protein R6Q57_013031 [Mikania cordata]